MALHTDKLIQKKNKRNYMNNRILLFAVAASLGCVNAVQVMFMMRLMATKTFTSRLNSTR